MLLLWLLWLLLFVWRYTQTQRKKKKKKKTNEPTNKNQTLKQQQITYTVHMNAISTYGAQINEQHTNKKKNTKQESLWLNSCTTEKNHTKKLFIPSMIKCLLLPQLF